jgi:hypothetical protein
MIPCEPCKCGGRRLVYRKVAGTKYTTRYRRCAQCGKCSKTIAVECSATLAALRGLIAQSGKSGNDPQNKPVLNMDFDALTAMMEVSNLTTPME